ncbi:MAG: DNA polymerase subunit beta [Methanomicrobiales archaeon HGW-Methanomicrobiales-4]|nr:MAG: DNA polymerase subunit beta [Methanomicrobiales archaeon HGW-Methanomicrobiales-4]
MDKGPVTMDAIRKVVDRLILAANPRKIILFGSYARGEETTDSDVDLMVIEDAVNHQGMEMVRLRKAAGRIAPGVGIDILEYPTEKTKEPVPGTVLYWALTEGKVMYEC